jgi:hypothetical protein
VAYESFPNIGHNNRAVSSAEYEQLSVPLGLSGLLNYAAVHPIIADSSGRHVKLVAGVAALIRGHRFNNLTETIIPIAANAAGQPRIDLVVLRLNRATYEIAPFVIQGNAAAAPIAPTAVRQNTLDGTGFWDIPLVEVRVANGATTIANADITHRAWWITGTGYVSTTDGRPPAEPGVAWFETNSNTEWIGMASGQYRRMAYSTGVITVTPPAGWSGQLRFARNVDTVFMTISIRRTGGNVANTSNMTVATITPFYRPPAQWDGVYHCSFPDHSSNIWINTDGTVVIAGTQNADGIPTNAYVFGSVTWPAAAA